MSQDIVTIRRQMHQVSSMLRQGKMVPSVTAVIAGVRLVVTTPLMKAEKSEMTDIIKEALSYLNNDRELRKLYPLELICAAGEEKKLLDDLQELLATLNEQAVSDAGELLRAAAEKKQASLAAGQGYLDAKQFDEARSVFTAISNEFPDDGELKGVIGQKVLAAGLYEDAAGYLASAVEINPQALNLYNHLAIALRKLGRFDVAEGYYMKALPMAPNDPYLLFNIGRLYLEWSKWDKAAEFGEKALKAQPDFAEANKLVLFAQKKIG